MPSISSLDSDATVTGRHINSEGHEDESSTESSAEPVQSYEAEKRLSRLYCDGKGFFDRQLHAFVFANSGDEDSFDRRDAYCGMIVVAFPYKKVLDMCKQRWPSRVPSMLETAYVDARHELLVLIGSVLNSNDDTDVILEGKLELAFGTCMGRSDTARESDPRVTPPRTPSPDIGLDRYTVALSAWKGPNGLTAVFGEPVRSAYDEMWEAQWVYDGKSYSARSEKKKHAQHKAARLACKDLGIPVLF